MGVGRQMLGYIDGGSVMHPASMGRRRWKHIFPFWTSPLPGLWSLFLPREGSGSLGVELAQLVLTVFASEEPRGGELGARRLPSPSP